MKAGFQQIIFLGNWDVFMYIIYNLKKKDWQKMFNSLLYLIKVITTGTSYY